MPQAMTAKARMLICGMLIALLSGCAGSGFAQWEWPPLPLHLVEEDPVDYAIYAYKQFIPIKAKSVLVLPLFYIGEIDGKTFEYAVARPFIYEIGSILSPPQNIRPQDGDVVMLVVIAPGYWQGDIGRVWLERHTVTIDGQKGTGIAMTPARSKAEARAVLDSFKLLLSRKSFINHSRIGFVKN